MRKATFLINDLEWMKRFYKLTDEEHDEIFGGKEPFQAVYVLIGNKNPDRYELTDINGNKLNINDLNGYERGVVLNDCYAYYMGNQFFGGISEPCGVMSITEELD